MVMDVDSTLITDEVIDLLGADGPLIPCCFAVARMAGLVAFVRESLDDIRLCLEQPFFCPI